MPLGGQFISSLSQEGRAGHGLGPFEVCWLPLVTMWEGV